ncbi:chemotaxis protein, partial [Candidatus Poribacteria bacterium]|nr:chemotaxis protein [Candidatus Poribacteria bacterium]
FTINEIARQTNLLALNAAIESARESGESRGFAIVAEEIRKLANHSAKATEDIQSLLLELQDATQKSVKATDTGMHEVSAGVHLVNEFLGDFETILDKIKGITNSVQEITIASREQANGANYLNSSMLKVNENTKNNVNKIKESKRTIEEVHSLSIELNELMQEFVKWK